MELVLVDMVTGAPSKLGHHLVLVEHQLEVARSYELRPHQSNILCRFLEQLLMTPGAQPISAASQPPDWQEIREPEAQRKESQ